MPLPRSQNDKRWTMRYPWKKWLKMKRFVVQKGVDYFCDNAVMAQQIRNKLYRAGLRAEILSGVDSESLTIRILPNKRS